MAQKTEKERLDKIIEHLKTGKEYYTAQKPEKEKRLDKIIERLNTGKEYFESAGGLTREAGDKDGDAEIQKLTKEAEKVIEKFNNVKEKRD